jgi:hypothetical protein
MKKLLRIDPDGTRVYWKNNKIYRISPASEPAGFYAPFHSRAEMYAGRVDPRTTERFADSAREQRQRTGGPTKAVNPGPQHL